MTSILLAVYASDFDCFSHDLGIKFNQYADDDKIHCEIRPTAWSIAFSDHYKRAGVHVSALVENSKIGQKEQLFCSSCTKATLGYFSRCVILIRHRPPELSDFVGEAVFLNIEHLGLHTVRAHSFLAGAGPKYASDSCDNAFADSTNFTSFKRKNEHFKCSLLILHLYL